MHSCYSSTCIFSLKMEKEDSYYTIKVSTSGIFKDRGSKFLSFAYRVDSREQVKKMLEKLRKEYHDARHHCFAYRLGADQADYRAFDDGEPSSSAGKPILGQIQAFNLSNILVVVVRYFGGTLLGVGGLINAYRSAARDALQNAEIIQMTDDRVLAIHFQYPSMDAVIKILNEEGMKILKRDFKETCIIETAIRKSHADKVIERLQRLQDVKVFNSY
jgi:uncharacterized YigZ family protein